MFSNDSIEAKGYVHKEYIPPSLVELIDSASKIRAEYKKKNADRLELISIIEVAHRNISRIGNNADKLNLARDISLGMWIYSLESIYSEYRLHNPSYKSGYVYNSGSTLYEIFTNKLKIKPLHQPSDKSKLYYLSKWYNFIFTKENTTNYENLKLLGLMLSDEQLAKLKSKMIEIMRRSLFVEHDEKQRVLRSIPCESSIDMSMIELQKDYIKQVKQMNVSRVFLARMAAAIANYHYKNEQNGDALISRSLRVKIGFLIYITESIKSTYYISYRVSNSTMYNLCDKALGKSLDYLNDNIKITCLSALEVFLKSDINRGFLEDYINKNSVPLVYIDKEVESILLNIKKIQADLTKRSVVSTISDVTVAMAALGAMLGSAPGYGTGYAIGYGLSLSDQVSLQKSHLSKTTNYAMSIIFGSGSYFGYYTADIIVSVTMERLFAKIFEALGALLGAIGLGTVSFVIYDMSFTTALQLGKLCLDLNSNFGSAHLRQSDVQFIQTLLELPREVFSDEEKNHLRKITESSYSISAGQLFSLGSTVKMVKVEESSQSCSSSEPEAGLKPKTS